MLLFAQMTPMPYLAWSHRVRESEKKCPKRIQHRVFASYATDKEPLIFIPKNKPDFQILGKFCLRSLKTTNNSEFIFPAFGNAFSIQIRCVCLLSYLNFCGKSGRTVLKTIVLAYVIAGR